MMKTTFRPIRESAKQKLLTYLPYFETPGAVFFVENGSHALEPFSYADRVEQFIADLYEGGFIQAFEWKSWEEAANRYMLHPEELQQADEDELLRLLIFHIRKERFQNGHLAHIIESGHLTALLGRWKSLLSA